MGFVSQVIYSVWFIFLRYPFVSKREVSNSRSRNKISDVVRRGPIIHRGGFPENTIEGFREAKFSHDASSVEVDLHFTKDGHPVLLHDDTVDRTSDGTGYISTMTLEEIKALDVGIKFGYAGARVPTLDETIQAVKDLDMFLFLEVKASNPKTIPTILEMFNNDRSLYDRVAVISFFPDVIYKLSQLDPMIIIGYTTRSTVFSRLANGEPRFRHRFVLKVVEYIEVVFYWMIDHFVRSVLTPSIWLPHKNDIFLERFNVEKHSNEGVVIITWTVNDKHEQQHVGEVLNLPYMMDPTVH